MFHENSTYVSIVLVELTLDSAPLIAFSLIDKNPISTVSDQAYRVLIIITIQSTCKVVS